MTDDVAAISAARRKTILIEQMLAHVDTICGDDTRARLDLTVASPGLIVSLFIDVVDAIDQSDLGDTLKAATRRAVQVPLVQLLRLVLQVVESPDPRVALLNQGATLAQSMDMGATNGEVH